MVVDFDDAGDSWMRDRDKPFLLVVVTTLYSSFLFVKELITSFFDNVQTFYHHQKHWAGI